MSTYSRYKYVNTFIQDVQHCQLHLTDSKTQIEKILWAPLLTVITCYVIATQLYTVDA